MNVSGFEPPTSIYCTCPARAICTWCQLFIRRCDAPAHMHQYAEFCVVSSKTHKPGGSYVFKVFPRLARAACTPRHRRLEKHLPTLGGYLSAKFSARATIGMACRLFIFPYVLHRVQIFARALHVQYALQVNYLYCVLKPVPKCTNDPSLVSLAQKFKNSGDPMLEKLAPSGTCCLCLSSLLTTMAPAPLW